MEDIERRAVDLPLVVADAVRGFAKYFHVSESGPTVSDVIVDPYVWRLSRTLRVITSALNGHVAGDDNRLPNVSEAPRCRYQRQWAMSRR
ncbi:hypothetical protein BKG76_21725 [Mycobacteroides franklinii]|uniref:Uncharacterized protein n=1 Tax=Mycobacteroides franklinii TaxID=948102 RepID=A0A1S1L3Q1_9MYCO|nr:hypothetical protein [Mycobacteroides franklinii]OHU19105.1 hypothetical protein BKG76_21725 [Mycobacteroides franklinii]